MTQHCCCSCFLPSRCQNWLELENVPLPHNMGHDMHCDWSSVRAAQWLIYQEWLWSQSCVIFKYCLRLLDVSVFFSLLLWPWLWGVTKATQSHSYLLGHSSSCLCVFQHPCGAEMCEEAVTQKNVLFSCFSVFRQPWWYWHSHLSLSFPRETEAIIYLSEENWKTNITLS